MSQDNFWETKSLNEMSDDEWESICDGCGRCCLVKLEDEDSHQVYLTNIACKLLDLESCRCQDYENRFKTVPMCMNLKTDLDAMVSYLPESCAYRLLQEGKPLQSWHPLLNTNANSIHDAGISVSEFAITEAAVHSEQVEQHIIGLINEDKE